MVIMDTISPSLHNGLEESLAGMKVKYPRKLDQVF